MSDGLVKICGVRTTQAAEAIAEADVDFAGFNLVPGARRSVSLQRAVELSRALDGQSTPVLVFRDAPLDDVLRAMDLIEGAIAQLHGNEDAGYVAAVEQVGRCFRAVSANRVRTRGVADLGSPSLWVIDAAEPGSGQRWDGPIDRRLLMRHWLLAGGLNPENVAGAVAAHTPDGVDVASGIERDGEQSPQRIVEFVKAARAAFRSLEE